MTAVIERCAMCGGDLGSARVIVGGQTFHPRCSHDARDHRITELEDVLIGAEIVIRMLAPAGQETTLETIRRALRRPT